MRTKPPIPVCKSFLVVSQIVDHTNGEVALVGLPHRFSKPAFPAVTQISFFARLLSGHGEYQVELQLQTPEGDTVWRDRPPQPWPLDNPLQLYDLKLLNFSAAFPKPGPYDFVLVMNDEEVARHPYFAALDSSNHNPSPGENDEQE